MNSSFAYSGEIISSQNERIKRVRKLAQKKHRRRERRVLVEGIRVLDAARSAGMIFETLFVSESFDPAALPTGDLSTLCSPVTQVFQVDDGVMASISEVDTSQGLLAVMETPVWDRNLLLQDLVQQPRWSLLWFEDVSDPGNLGTIVRSAHALGAAATFASADSAEYMNPKTIRASAGSVFHSPGFEDVQLSDLLDVLRPLGCSVVATDPGAVMTIGELSPPDRSLLLVGQEAHGLSAAALACADVSVSIPMVASANSLNVGAATAIFLHHLSPLRR